MSITYGHILSADPSGSATMTIIIYSPGLYVDDYKNMLGASCMCSTIVYLPLCTPTPCLQAELIYIVPALRGPGSGLCQAP